MTLYDTLIQTFQHPAIQSAAAPFVAAFLSACLLRNTRHWGLALCLGFLSMVALAAGLSINWQAPSAFQKIVLSTCLLMVLACLLPTQSPSTNPNNGRSQLFNACAALLACWVAWRFLAQHEGSTWLLRVLAVAAFSVSILLPLLRRERTPQLLTHMTVMHGLAAAGMGLMGASALLAFSGISIAAGAFALLVLPGRWRSVHGSGTAVALACWVCALATLTSVLSAQIPWYGALPCWLMAWMPQGLPGSNRPAWQRIAGSLAASTLVLTLGLFAVWLALSSTNAS